MAMQAPDEDACLRRPTPRAAGALGFALVALAGTGRGAAQEPAPPRLDAARGFQPEHLRTSAGLADPLGLAFDDRGRAWIARGDGALVVLDRPGGDAVERVACTGLTGLSAFLPDGEGVLVATAEGLLRLGDADGDGVLEERRLLWGGLAPSGWAVRALVRGLDGRVVGALGPPRGRTRVSPGSTWAARAPSEDDGTPAAPVSVPAGVFRLSPAGDALEAVVAVEGGATDVVATPTGETFFLAAEAGPAHVVLPDAALAAGAYGAARSWVPLAPAGPSSAAEALGAYGGGAWPEAYGEGLLALGDAGLRWLPLEAAGPTFRSRVRAAELLLASAGGAFRPVDVATGPSGALHVLEVGEGIGRLWRLGHGASGTAAVPRLPVGAELGALFEELAHPNAWRRGRAQRALAARGLAPEEAKALEVRARSDTEPWIKLHALWLDGGRTPLVGWALGDHSAWVRRAALAVVAARTEQGPGVPAPSIVERVRDPDRRVRLLALVAWRAKLEAVHLDRLVELWPRLADDTTRAAALAVAQRNPRAFLRAVFRHGGDPAFADPLAFLSRGLAARGSGKEAVELLMVLVEGRDAPALVAAVLDGLVLGSAPDRTPWPSPRLARALRRHGASGDVRVALGALPLAERWASDQIAASQLAGWVRAAADLSDDRERSLELRLRGLNALLATRAGRAEGQARADLLLRLLEGEHDAPFALSATVRSALVENPDAALAARARALFGSG